MAVCHPFFVLILFCNYSVSTIAQITPIPKQVSDAYKATLELKINESKILLNTNNNLSIHPVNILVEDYNDVLELIIDEDISLFDKYEEKKDNRLNKLDDLVDKKSPWYNLIKAEIKFHWGIANFKFNNELTSAWNINQAHSLIKENQKKFPDFKPNLKTLGVFHIVIGAIPNNYQWIM